MQLKQIKWGKPFSVHTFVIVHIVRVLLYCNTCRTLFCIRPCHLAWNKSLNVPCTFPSIDQGNHGITPLLFLYYTTSLFRPCGIRQYYETNSRFATRNCCSKNMMAVRKVTMRGSWINSMITARHYMKVKRYIIILLFSVLQVFKLYVRCETIIVCTMLNNRIRRLNPEINGVGTETKCKSN